MAVIKPFNALRPQQQLSQQVASRPYDVVKKHAPKQQATRSLFCISPNQRLICPRGLISIARMYTIRPKKISTSLSVTELYLEKNIPATISTSWS